MKNLSEINLYIDHCYNCDRTKRYQELNKFILKNKISLSVFKIRRIQLSQKWQDDARINGLRPPFIRFAYNNGEDKFVAYEDFVKNNNVYKIKKVKKIDAEEQVNHIEDK